jgi:hypothetical protein
MTFDLSSLPMLQLWAACRDAGFALVWSPTHRAVILRPIRETGP